MSMIIPIKDDTELKREIKHKTETDFFFFKIRYDATKHNLTRDNMTPEERNAMKEILEELEEIKTRCHSDKI